MGSARRGLGFAVMVMVLIAGFGVSSQLPAAVATSACPSGVVALTFDDGPNVHTAEVLDVLAAHRAPGTFFVIGQNVERRPELVRRAADEGHEVANHSYTHRDLELLTHEEIRSEVAQTDRAIREAGVVPLALLRPPFGHWDGPGGLVATAAEAEGYRVVTWTYSPTDYLNDAETIRTRVLANLHPDANLLFHDGSSNAPELIAALPDIIQGARDQGYCLGVLDHHGRVVARHLERFVDVPADSVHAAAIERLAAAGITQGCTEDRYCPGDPIARDQMASLLARSLDLQAQPSQRFVDVPVGSVHAGAIEALAAVGITEGCTPYEYCPHKPVRRDQMASFLVRALDLPMQPGPGFTDVRAGSVHAEAIETLAATGITKGCTVDRYCPEQEMRRDQMASFLVRALLDR